MTTGISFDSLDWQVTASGAREKVLERGSKRVRLVELTDAFVHDGWCTVGHSVYVFEGTLELIFDDRIEQIAAGEASLIPGGFAHRHKPTDLGARVRMLVVDDVQ